MRLLVTDQDSGSLKEIVFPENANTSDKTAPQPSSILVYAKAGNARHAQSVLRVGDKGQWIMVARKDGSVSLYEASEPAAPTPEPEPEQTESTEENKNDKTTQKKNDKQPAGCPTLDGADGRYPLVYEWPANTAIYPKPADAKKYERGDAVVGMVEEYAGGIVMTLSKEGKLVAYDVISASMAAQSNEKTDNETNETVFSEGAILGSVNLPGKTYTCIAAHPSQPGIFAVGGNEIEMQVYGADWEKEEEDQDESEKGEEPKLSKKLTQVWAPKNVKKDELDLPVPVWLENIFFLEEPSRTEPISSVPWSFYAESEDSKDKKEYEFTTKIATVTHHGEVRIYDPTKRQRPVKRLNLVPNGEFLGIAGVGRFHFNIPEAKEASQGDDDDEEEEDIYSTTPLSLLVADRKTSIFVVDVDPKDQSHIKMVGKLHGATGSVGAFATFAQPTSDPISKDKNSTDQYVVTGSLDRFVRIYEVTTRKQVAKVYVGTRPTGIVVLDGFEKSYGPGFDGETVEKVAKRKQEKEDDELWSKLGNAEDIDDDEDEDMEEEEEEVIIEDDEDDSKKKRKSNKNGGSSSKQAPKKKPRKN